jgi:hypothetical protein
VQHDTTAAISHDPDKDESKFSAYDGSMIVALNDGTSQEVGSMQEVTQSGGKLSRPASLPDPPVPVLPEDNYEAFLSAESEIILKWQEVPGAQRYALQVARNRFFVQNVIDVDDREETSAKVGIQATGIFVWRVSAVDGSGVQGPWSELRRFRVTTGETLEGASTGASDAASASDAP